MMGTWCTHLRLDRQVLIRCKRYRHAGVVEREKGVKRRRMFVRKISLQTHSLDIMLDCITSNKISQVSVVTEAQCTRSRFDFCGLGDIMTRTYRTGSRQLV